MGAWEYNGYHSITRAYDDPRLGAALVAVKRELKYNGYGTNLVTDTPVFGDAAENRTIEFQRDHGITPDGIIGPGTASELFRRRINMTEARYGLPTGSIGKQIKLESNFDPVATGYADPDDTGIAQINLRIHSSITKDQAFDPAFAIDWMGQYISSSQDAVVKNANVMKAARAAYNIGNTYATQWLLSDFAESGGPMLGNEDSFTRATNYIKLIDSQDW